MSWEPFKELDDNEIAFDFYESLNLRKICILKRQVKIHNGYKDEVLMEIFL